MLDAPIDHSPSRAQAVESCPSFDRFGARVRTPSARDQPGERPATELPFVLIAQLTTGKGECDSEVAFVFNTIADIGPVGECTREARREEQGVGWTVACSVRTPIGVVRRTEFLIVGERAYHDRDGHPAYPALFTLIVGGDINGQPMAAETRCKYEGFVAVRDGAPPYLMCE